MISLAPPALALAAGEVHLWFAFPAAPQLHDPQLLERYQQLMTGEERARQQRYLQARHRHEALVARALVRTTLSRYAPEVPAGRWRFVAGEHGRPEIADPPHPGLRFNLSHTGGLMLCGVTLDRAIGVDVEDSRRRVEGPGIARRFFAPAEVRALERGELAFFELWTLKEAYIKARGQGLALPLRRFAFRRRDHDISVTFEPELGDDAGAWRFLLLGVQPSHVAALALRTGADAAPPTVRVGQVVPLHREGELPCAVLGRTGER